MEGPVVSDSTSMPAPVEWPSGAAASEDSIQALVAGFVET